MTLAPAAQAEAPAPAAILHAIVTVLFAGAAATLAFDFFGQVLSPMLKSVASPYLGSKLAPVPLASQVLSKLTGLPGKELGALGLPYGLHILTGLLAYPLGYLLMVRPLHRAVLPALPWAVPAALYGVALWVLALYVLAHLVAGNPAFLGWTGITWVALWGHVIFALVAAAVIEARLPR